jgi:hypothetical protein
VNQEHEANTFDSISQEHHANAFDSMNQEHEANTFDSIDHNARSCILTENLLGHFKTSNDFDQ